MTDAPPPTAPGPCSSGPLAGIRRWSSGTVALVLTALCLAFYLPNLGRPDFDKKGEPREGAIVGEMLDTGDAFLPLVNGHRLPEKPLFYSWLAVLSALVFGLNEFAMRFPSALAATAGVVATYLAGERLFNRRAGLFAALTLAVSLNYYALATKARIDMTLCLGVTLALLSFAAGYFGEPKRARRWYLLAALFMGLAGLSKGPLGCVLPVWVVLVFLAWRRDWRGLWDVRPISNALVVIVLLCAWYVPAWWLARDRGLEKGPEGFLEVVLYKENIGMPLGEVDGGGHAHGFFYYLPVLLTSFFPWVFFLPAAFWGMRKLEGVERSKVGFFAVWFLGGLFMFSVAKGKRADYLVPLYPGAALLLGHAWDRWMLEVRPGALRRRLVPATFCWAAVALLFVMALSLASAPTFVQTVTEGATRLGAWAGGGTPASVTKFLGSEDWAVTRSVWQALQPHFGVFAALITFCVICGAIGSLAAFAARPRVAFAACWTFMAGMCFLTTRLFLPAVTIQYSIRPFLQQVRDVVPAEAPLYAVRSFDYAMPFYLRRHAPDIAPEELIALQRKGIPAYAIIEEAAWPALHEAMGDRILERVRSGVSREAGCLILVQIRS